VLSRVCSLPLLAAHYRIHSLMCDACCLQLDEMITTAKGLSEYYRAVQDDRTNRTLYILTLVTSIFVPAQFLTGLYGTVHLAEKCSSSGSSK
jgi:hypothetical protein